jgi:xylan 1,4-beta-xylosidase
MKIQKLFSIILLFLILLNSGTTDANDSSKPALKDVFEEHFLIGGAFNRRLVSDKDPNAAAIAIKHFNTATAENDMKWSLIHPEPNEYNWEPADRFVEFAEKNNMVPIGHCLIWHAQVPRWTFRDESGELLTREALLARMKDHITTVVGRYKGRVKGWDVVNEALRDDGTLRRSRWPRIISEGDEEKQYDFIAKAFQYAHEADPDAELYYNDYNLDTKKEKCDGAVKIVKYLKSKGIRIDGVGVQMHCGFDYPDKESLEYCIKSLAATGVKVMATELDIRTRTRGYRGADIRRVNRQSTSDSDADNEETQQKLADKYAELFSIFVKHKKDISRVTFWGVYDATSWIGGSPLLFDQNCQPKQAFYAVCQTADAVVNTVQNGRTFHNPVIPGFYPDPSICRVGDDYYLVNSTFEYFPGVPIFHSKDLVHWKQIGYCLTRKSRLPLEKTRASGGIYAPTIRYNNGTFYMVTTNVDGGGNFYVTAKNPAGPWSEPVWLDNQGIDPSLLFDDDGKVYYCRHVGQGDGYIGQTTLNLETGKLEGELRKIWGGTGGIWAEGPHLYKINGKYYLMISEGGTSYGHCVTIARSDSPWGPFESNPNNPILTHRNLDGNPIRAVGHADLVETPDGWWLVCLAIRPQGGNFHHMGRETFLAPVVFNEQGWPVVNGKGTISLEMTAPKLKQHVWEQPPARDEFDAESFALQWNFLRNPHEADYSLTEYPGYLRLKGSALTMSDQDSPAFVGRRQTDFNCTVSTLLEFEPESDNEEAGLVARQNDRFHYDLGVTLRENKRQIFLRKVVDSKVIEPIRYVDIQPGPVTLSIRANPLSYEFFCTSSSGEKQSLGTALTKDLSVEVIGFEHGMCFTGVYFGMYATGNGEKCTSPADFDWFEYIGN